MKLLELAEELGVPREEAEELANKVLLYELAPEEAEARLRQLTAKTEQ